MFDQDFETKSTIIRINLQELIKLRSKIQLKNGKEKQKSIDEQNKYTKELAEEPFSLA